MVIGMGDHPPKTPAIFVGEPMVQAHVRVPDSVNRSEWLRRRSGRNRRRSVGGSRHAGGASVDGGGGSTAEGKVSPPPRERRDISVDSRTSSLATSVSRTSTTSRLSMASIPPQQTQLRQENNHHRLGARRYSDGVGDQGRRRRPLDAGPVARPRRSEASVAAAAAAAAETLSSSSSSSSTRCGVCLADFTRYRRPHRCRACGKTVCATCSPARRPKRTCKRCAGDSAAPRVVATASPRQAVVAPNAQTAGVARAARRSVGSSARVLVGAPSKPVAVVAGATYPATASAADGPKEVRTGELEVPSSPGSASVGKEGAKASSCVGDVDDGETADGSDLLSGVGRGGLEESASPAENGNEEMEGLDRLGGGCVETVGTSGNASRVEHAVRSFPNDLLSNSSPSRMGHKSKRKSTAAAPDDSVRASPVASGRDGFPPLSSGASDDTEGRGVVCGAEATTAGGDRAVSSEGGGDVGRELEEAAGWCLPADSSAELAASPIIDGESSHKDEALKPSVNGHSAPEVVAASEAAAAASCAAASPQHSPPNLKRAEQVEQQSATLLNSDDPVPEPYPIESRRQPEAASCWEPATQLEEAAQPEEEGVFLPQQVLSQPIRRRWPSGEDERVQEEEEEGEEHEDGGAQEMEDIFVEGRRVNNEEEGTEEDVLVATVGLCAESSVDEGPVMGTDRETTDLVAADVPQDKQEGQWDNESKEAMVEGRDGYRRKDQGVVRAAAAGLRLENGGDEKLVAAERGAADSLATAAPQQSNGQGRCEDKDVEAATTTVGGGQGEAAVDFSTAGRGSTAESRVSETAAEPEKDSGLLVTLPTDEDAERGTKSQHEHSGGKERKEEEEGTAVVTEVGAILQGPSDKAPGLVDSEPAAASVSVSLAKEERARGQESDAAENVIGGNSLCDRESGVADKSLVAAALPRDEELGGGGLQLTVESPRAPSWGVPEGADNNINVVGPHTTAGGESRGEATTIVAPPPACHSNPHTTRIETRIGAESGDIPSSRGVVVSAGGDEGAGSAGEGGFLAALKGLVQKGGSCCR